MITVLSGHRPAFLLAATTTLALAGVVGAWWLDRAVERALNDVAGAA